MHLLLPTLLFAAASAPATESRDGKSRRRSFIGKIDMGAGAEQTKFVGKIDTTIKRSWAFCWPRTPRKTNLASYDPTADASVEDSISRRV